MISALQQGFVNTWLLARDLDGIAGRSGDADLAKVARLIKDHYGYPVDSVLITPDLRVVGHLNVHDQRATAPGGYLAFLRAGLAAARGEAAPAGASDRAATRAAPATRSARARGPRGVTLTPAEPAGSVLDVIVRRPFGKQSMTFFPIDATAFPGAGTIEVTVRMGGQEASGRFELCAASGGGMTPVRTLDRVTRGETATMTWEFTKGARFGLAVIPGPGSAEGEANAFLATVTVRGR